jgi:hypothetical protein
MRMLGFHSPVVAGPAMTHLTQSRQSVAAGAQCECQDGERMHDSDKTRLTQAGLCLRDLGKCNARMAACKAAIYLEYPSLFLVGIRKVKVELMLSS